MPSLVRLLELETTGLDSMISAQSIDRSVRTKNNLASQDGHNIACVTLSANQCLTLKLFIAITPTQSPLNKFN